MELAGLACAQTVATVYDVKKYNRVLVCCGPGNQVRLALLLMQQVRSVRRLSRVGMDLWQRDTLVRVDTSSELNGMVLMTSLDFQACSDTSRLSICQRYTRVFPSRSHPRYTQPPSSVWVKGNLSGRAH